MKVYRLFFRLKEETGKRENRISWQNGIEKLRTSEGPVLNGDDSAGQDILSVSVLRTVTLKVTVHGLWKL